MPGAIPDSVNGRHTFAHERLLILLATATREQDGLRCSKRELADAAGLNQWSIDRAVARLRNEGDVESYACFDGRGCQLGNEYRVTEQGARKAERLLSRAG